MVGIAELSYQPCRILLLDPDRTDAEETRRVVFSTLPDCVIAHSLDSEDFVANLDEFHPDLILSEYEVPDFDGLAALKIVLKKLPFVPFIMVTSIHNEAFALEGLKAGATDYVIKGSMARLGFSIVKALNHKKLLTEGIKAIETIRENEEKYRYLFEKNPQPMWIYDLETLNYLGVNQSAIQIYGYSKNEFLIRSIRDIEPMEDFTTLSNVYAGHEHNATSERRHLKKNGELIYVEIILHEIVFDNRQAGLVLIKDITDRKKVEEAIRNERNLLRTLIDHLPDTIYVKDKNARKIVANRADLEAMGFKDENEITGKTDLEIFPGLDGKRGYEEDIEVLSTGKVVTKIEAEVTDMKGNRQILATSKYPLIDEEGNIIGLVGVGRNITEKKQDEEKIITLLNGIEQSPISVMITGVNGIIEYVNPKLSEVSGYAPSEVIGNTPRLFKSEHTPVETYIDLWRTILSGHIWKGVLRNKKKNGELYWESIVITPVKNNKSVITNFLALKEDITLRRQMEADLLKAKEKAEESDRLKSAFLANMSHEIRTPLNSILGFSELLSDPELPLSDREKYADIVTQSGENLLSIINDVLDFSKIESGQINLVFSQLSAVGLLQELYVEFNYKAEKKGLSLQLSPSIEGLELVSDRLRIKQILGNYISNALKFTPSGFIEIGALTEDHQIRFYVRDSGIGIPKDLHQIIFKRFRQIESAFTREFGGNGLGLAIVKHLAKLMGGTVGVESEPGIGSTFFLILPLNP